MKETHFFYVPKADVNNELPKEEIIHALKVLRLNIGDEIFLIDGKGFFYTAIISEVKGIKHCYYEIKRVIPQTPIWRNHIHLAIAPTKDIGRIEWMVEKATEIGIDEITFLDCAFSERKTLRTDRIERIVISAMKQSRKAWKPIINAITPLNKFIDTHIKGAHFFCHCYNELERKDLFTELSSISQHDQEVIVLIGPEGDFSIDEVKNLVKHWGISCSLGNSRLRTETAGLEAVMMMNLSFRL